MKMLRATVLLSTMLAIAACGDDGSSSGSGSGGGASATSGGDGGETSSGSPSTSTVGGTTTGATSVTSTGVTTATTATTSTGDATASSSASTGAGPLECTGASPSFAADVQPILTASCAVTNCHKGAHPDKSLDLSEGNSWAAIVGVETVECSHGKTRVTAGDPSMSYLVHKIRNEELCPNTRRMPPPNKDLLEPDEVQTIVDWVCTGALDN